MIQHTHMTTYDIWGGANFKENSNKNFFECFVLLSLLLGSTSTMYFGQLVTCNSYRNPALLAKMISTMDIISDGRIELEISQDGLRMHIVLMNVIVPPPLKEFNNWMKH
jgi:alkanesulfonate monooxygenase SsuD/methylene tetrahydromethanopterin reductase-like flavin-dependent oxidoreductase (luciferase family)